MKRVLCRFCGTRDHHPSEMHLCKAMEVLPATEEDRRQNRRIMVAGEITLPKTATLTTAGEPHIEKVAEKRLEVAKKALTRAEISRRQRERDPEGYKLRNRLRMRKARAK